MKTNVYLTLAAAVALASTTATARTISYEEGEALAEIGRMNVPDFAGKPDGVPPGFAGQPDNVPPDFAGKPDDVPRGFAGKPDNVPPEFAGKPDDVPRGLVGKPANVPPDFAGKPDEVPPDFAGKPDGVPPDFAGRPDLDEGSIGEVPIPAAAWLFGSGLVGLIGIARRRTHKSNA